MNEWDKVKNQLSTMTKNLTAKQRSDINDMIFKKAKTIMSKKSLSLIYDKFGNQQFEKTATVQNYVQVQKHGFDLAIWQDDSKLIETKPEQDQHRTDFIEYGSLKNIDADTVKYQLDNGFEPVNTYLYNKSLKKELKQKVFNDGIDELKGWINSEGIVSFNKMLNNNKKTNNQTINKLN